MKGGNAANDQNWNTHLDKGQLSLSVDCVIFGYDELELKVLLINSDMPIFDGLLSLPGDLVQADENLNSAATRVLESRTGLNDVFMEQVMAFSNVDRHPLGRVVTIAYYSLVEVNHHSIKNISNQNAKWYNLKDVGKLAFDHNEILANCLQRLRLRLQEQPIGFNLLPQKFTLNQLQNLYEKVLGVGLDKRNFRRKLKSIDVLIDMEEHQKDVMHRPAKLYSFDKEKYKKKNKKGMFINF